MSVLVTSVICVVTAAAAQGADEVKWISTLRELGGWGVAGLAIYFLNHSVEKERKDREERDRATEKRDQTTQVREALVIAALQESARVGERLAGAVGGLTELIRDRREALDGTLDRLLSDLGHLRHDARNLLAGQAAQGQKLSGLVHSVATCRNAAEACAEILTEMQTRGRKEPTA